MKIISNEEGQAPMDMRRLCCPTASPIDVEVGSAGERFRAHLRNSEGGALVEFAVVLPILLLVLTGIFTFGIAMNNYNELTEAVNTGARLLAISRGQATDPCAVTAAAVYAAAPTLTQKGLSLSFVLNGNPYSGASCPSSSTTTGAAGNLVEGQPAEVIVTYPCNLAIYGINLAPGCTLQAQTTELVQ
jgi:hypothetical protein